MVDVLHARINVARIFFIVLQAPNYPIVKSGLALTPEKFYLPLNSVNLSSPNDRKRDENNDFRAPNFVARILYIDLRSSNYHHKLPE